MIENQKRDFILNRGEATVRERAKRNNPAGAPAEMPRRERRFETQVRSRNPLAQIVW